MHNARAAKSGVLGCLLFFLCVSFLSAGIHETTRVLFLGNSYTSWNNLADLFTEIAAEKGYTVEALARAPGGWSLEQHVRSQKTRAILHNADWDYIVLQEQSVIPSVKNQREKKMYPAVRSFTRLIRGKKAQPVLFMTWAWRRGLPDLGMNDYQEMQNNIIEGYGAIARELHINCAPVGQAWSKAVEKDPGLDLWHKDNSHPSRTGSYLAACVFFAAIFGESPYPIKDTAGIGQHTAEFLQKIAAEVVL
jgi:hypothetical protein